MFSGRPNATTSRKFNDIFNIYAVLSRRWLARAQNISRGSPMTPNPSTSMTPSTASTSLLDASQGHQYHAGSPNTTATGKPRAQLNIGNSTHPKTAQERHC
ncbi:hypothetical protein FB107DRAFT_277792 [Schizophyllum commune]